jgi:hypothetical protein
VSDALAQVATLPGVADAVADARGAVDRLRGHRVLRRGSAVVTTESILRGARASAALEGADLPLEAVRRSVQEGAPLPGPAGAIIQGALRVTAESAPLLAAWERAPLQALARLHVLAAADLLPPEALGRPGTHGTEAAERLAALARLLVVPTSAPAVVVAAVVHGELLAVAPFPVGNGLVARAAQRLVLVGRGLDPTAVSVPEVGHVELGAQEYAAVLRGYLAATPEGVSAWVVHCARAIALGAREGVAVCEAVQRGLAHPGA